MKIVHRETEKTIILEEIGQKAGYRERLAFAASVALRSDCFAHNQVTSARYRPQQDKWFGTAGNFKVKQEASASLEILEEHGFNFIHDEEDCVIELTTPLQPDSGGTIIQAQIDRLKTDKIELLNALEALRDEQNGPPLVRHADRWQAAYDKACAILDKHNPPSNG